MKNSVIQWSGMHLKGRPDLFRLDAKDLRVQAEIPSILEGIADVGSEEKDTLDYCDAVSAELIRKKPEIGYLASEIKNRLDGGVRFVIVDGMGFHTLEKSIQSTFIAGFCNLIGRPTATDQKDGKIIWDVKPREYTEHKNTTFSEHNGEAEFHTDTQFISEPERYMSLWVLQHARDGGGTSGLIDARECVRHLMLDRIGRSQLDILSSVEMPFRVPSVFTKGVSDNDVEVVTARIFDKEPFIRYRKDTIKQGISVTHQQVDSDIRDAMQALEQVLHREDIGIHQLLKSGQVIFGNNHELLHGRSSFLDQERRLLRVRMSERVAI